MADALKKANAENKVLAVENNSLRIDLERSQKDAAALSDYYHVSEEKMKILRERAKKAEAAAKALTLFAAQATESAKQACYTLRLALNGLGASAEGAPSEDALAVNFSEWTQEAAGAVVEVVSAYGDYCARVLAGFALSLLQEYGCEHVAQFSELAKKDWPHDAKPVAATVLSFQRVY